MSLKRIVESIRKYKHFLITSHTNLEGDALGAELAFYFLVKKLGKQAVIINEDKTPLEYNFLPIVNRIKRFDRKIRKAKFDCFVVLDCSDLKRTGEVYRLNSGNKPILNIDHHISNQVFGNINWVKAEASSCSEMIYQLYKRMHVGIDKDAALALYVGIITDTGSFRYSNTSSFTHKAAAELLKFGFNVHQIYKQVYENIPLEDIRLLTQILPSIRMAEQGRVAWLKIERKILGNRKPSFDLTDHILSFARAIKGVEVVALFKENFGKENEVRINFRSQGKVDVNKIAAYFGGGGHKTASGATVQGNLNKIIKLVLGRIKNNLK